MHAKRVDKSSVVLFEIKNEKQMYHLYLVGMHIIVARVCVKLCQYACTCPNDKP